MVVSMHQWESLMHWSVDFGELTDVLSQTEYADQETNNSAPRLSIPRNLPHELIKAHIRGCSLVLSSDGMWIEGT